MGLFQNLPVLLVVRVSGKTMDVICIYARSLRRSFNSSVDRRPRLVSYLSKSSLTVVVPVVSTFSLHKSSSLSKIHSSFSSKRKTFSLTVTFSFISVKYTKHNHFYPTTINIIQDWLTSDRPLRLNSCPSSVSTQNLKLECLSENREGGETAEIMDQFRSNLTHVNVGFCE